MGAESGTHTPPEQEEPPMNAVPAPTTAVRMAVAAATRTVEECKPVPPHTVDVLLARLAVLEAAAAGPTQHTCGGPKFGRLTAGCPRCDELANGDAARPGGPGWNRNR
jgi:hypothetical protein